MTRNIASVAPGVSCRFSRASNQTDWHGCAEIDLDLAADVAVERRAAASAWRSADSS